MQVRSCTVTTSAACRVGGTTKLGPWTTSTAPVHHSMAGWSDRRHAWRKGRAAIGRFTIEIPGGTDEARASRPRQVTPKATTSRSGRPGSRASTSWANTPTPVRAPISEVASKASSHRVGQPAGSWSGRSWSRGV